MFGFESDTGSSKVVLRWLGRRPDLVQINTNTFAYSSLWPGIPMLDVNNIWCITILMMDIWTYGHILAKQVLLQKWSSHSCMHILKKWKLGRVRRSSKGWNKMFKRTFVFNLKGCVVETGQKMRKLLLPINNKSWLLRFFFMRLLIYGIVHYIMGFVKLKTLVLTCLSTVTGNLPSTRESLYTIENKLEICWLSFLRSNIYC